MNGTCYRHYELSKKEKRDCIITAYVCLFVAAYIFYHSVIISALTIIAIPYALKLYCRYAAERRKEKLTAEFKDVLYSLSASFAAGRHMKEGLAEAYDNLRLIYDDDAPMVAELANMIVKMSESRASEEEILRDFAARSDSRDIQSFVEIYFICRATGADTQKVISNAAEVLMDKISIQREIKTLTAQKRMEGKIISLMPMIIILFLNIASPDYMEALYSSMMGRAVMTAALLGIGYSYYLITKLTKVEV